MSTTVFIRHQVADFDAWKPGYEEHGSVRREYGLTDAGLYQGADDPNNVTIVLDAADPDRAAAFLAHDGLQETMEKVGVVGAPDIWTATTA